MKSILDPKFKYIPSYETDIRKRFQKIREQQKKKEAEDKAPVIGVIRRAANR